ncbi:hypothetical protein PIB30_002511 [Stylosanthes scabra]|uniref:Uncharacterized protein n=1 Tax=Stylosanthes scabra TaxID=79078 RepID=A0ABU6XZR7_9FABA|nr:hypothetical protein [Stylosanthes scabra]
MNLKRASLASSTSAYASTTTSSFSLFFFFTLFFSRNNAQAVVDTYGDPITAGDGEYFNIQPPVIGLDIGGGLRLGKTGYSRCSNTVLQDPNYLVTGIPVKFTNLRPVVSGDDNQILEGSPLEIEFVESEKPDCVESSKWEVFIDYHLKRAYIGIGGKDDHPGSSEPLKGTFRIKNVGLKDNVYKLEFCGTGLPSCFVVSKYDNSRDDDGGERLVLANYDPFTFIFVKKQSSIPSIKLLASPLAN